MVSGSMLEKITVSPHSGWLAHEKACLIGSSMIIMDRFSSRKCQKTTKTSQLGKCRESME